jgi:3-phenylpropionate/trans-cinnamate dioxygenase ferredoxin reductase subunit
VVILGAGHAGGAAAALLRQYGYGGSITLIGDEPIAPYQRPPLSKAWLKGEASADELALRPQAFYREHGIDFRPRTRATRLNAASKAVELQERVALTYQTLVLATGARAISLAVPGSDLPGVLSLRTAADADRLKGLLGPGKRLVVVGGGYIGLEVAASGRALGAKVVVLERETRLLARVACEPLSEFFKSYHERSGVTFELGSTVVAFSGDAGGVTAVHLSDGREIGCDVAVVGIGAQPNDEIARQAGLECSGGVVVDLDGRTSDATIFAIGDVARRPVPLYNRSLRLESVANALEQARRAAAAIAGRPPPAPEVPWFWSDQYDLKLQIAGLPFDADARVLRGDPAAASFAVFHLQGDRLQAVEAVNAGPEFMAGRQLILNRKAIKIEKLADPRAPMREVAA